MKILFIDAIVNLSDLALNAMRHPASYIVELRLGAAFAFEPTT
jgi:hypothetical protein